MPVKKIAAVAVLVSVIFCLRTFAEDVESKGKIWKIVLGDQVASDEAIKVAVSDLQTVGKEVGLQFELGKANSESPVDAILVGNAKENPGTANLLKQGKIGLQPLSDPQGYEIITLRQNGGRTMVVSGGSVIGDVYGIYWLIDRIRVNKEIPDINTKKEPLFKIRSTRSIVTSKEDIRKAFRYTINVVYGENPLSLIPWDSEPEKSENEKKRAAAKELIAYAHALHMQYFAFGTEFTYHPSLLKECGARLSPSDPAFWDVVQSKFRRLLQAMPELDGVVTFTGEEQMYWGNYQTFDPMHAGEDCDWSLEKRYRTFIKKIHNVVVGEFDKIYCHITWDCNPNEGHAQPEVYKRIFTTDVPTKNFYLMPSFTQNDRWWFQPYNPTFNVTPHNMLVQCETMDYHHGAKVFPSFPGYYFQAGLQTAMIPDAFNLKGLGLDMPYQDGWDTRNVTAYTVSRLAWECPQSIEALAEDFAAIYFGKAAAKQMAELYLLSPVAYKYGLYIEPVTYGQFTSLPQLRVATFPVMGYPVIDKGKEHISFLQRIYLRCKPWIAETNLYLDHGLQTIEQMNRLYQSTAPLIVDKKLAQDVSISLQVSKLLIKINGLYAKMIFAYFGYRENPIEERKQELQRVSSEIRATRADFVQTPGFDFNLYGIDQLLINVEQALADLKLAEQTLKKAPTPEMVETMIAAEQIKYVDLLKNQHKNAVKFFHWEGRVDGSDILKIKDKSVEVEHIRWDMVYFKDFEFFMPLPKKSVTVIPVDIDSRPLHPFILEQPSKENGFTVKVYLEDTPGGAGWCKFDLYYIAKSPDALDLGNPWQQ